MGPNFKAWYFRKVRKLSQVSKVTFQAWTGGILNQRSTKLSLQHGKLGFVKLFLRKSFKRYTLQVWMEAMFSTTGWMLVQWFSTGAVDQCPNLPDGLHTQDDRVTLCSNIVLRLSTCSRVTPWAANSAPHSATWEELSTEYVSLDKVQITLCGPRKI